jgi:hypothetical protein
LWLGPGVFHGAGVRVGVLLAGPGVVGPVVIGKVVRPVPDKAWRFSSAAGAVGVGWDLVGRCPEEGHKPFAGLARFD